MSEKGNKRNNNTEKRRIIKEHKLISNPSKKPTRPRPNPNQKAKDDK